MVTKTGSPKVDSGRKLPFWLSRKWWPSYQFIKKTTVATPPITSATISFDSIVSNMVLLLYAALICPSAPNCCNCVVTPNFSLFHICVCSVIDQVQAALLICRLEACELFTFEDDRLHGMQDGALGSILNVMRAAISEMAKRPRRVDSRRLVYIT